MRASCSMPSTKRFMIGGPFIAAGWFIIPTAVRKADSTGRRNTLIVEVFSSGDKGLAREDERGS